MKILHVGLCVQPKPYNGFQQAFIDVVGEDNYREKIRNLALKYVDMTVKMEQLFNVISNN